METLSQPESEERSVETLSQPESEPYEEPLSAPRTTRPTLATPRKVKIPAKIAGDENIVAGAGKLVIEKIVQGFEKLQADKPKVIVSLFCSAMTNRRDSTWQKSLPIMYELAAKSEVSGGKRASWGADFAATTTRLVRRAYDQTYCESDDLGKEDYLKRREKVTRIIWGSVNGLIKATRRPEPIAIPDAIAGKLSGDM